MTTLQEGSPAPAWSTVDQHGTQHTSHTLLGSWVLLYFYPKDDTPGCTTEACGLRDAFAEYAKRGVVVLGVSPDSEKSHSAFAKKFSLPFSLLADENHTIVQAYNVWQKKSMYGKEYFGVVRTSFLIDPRGSIAKIYEKVKPEEHAREVLQDVDTLQQEYTTAP